MTEKSSTMTKHTRWRVESQYIVNICGQEKPRKSYTTDDESDFSDTDSGSREETWTKSPRKEKIESDRSVASSSSSATSSSPPCVSSRAASVADRGDKVGPRHKKEKKNLPGIETRETQYSPVVSQEAA